MPTLNHIKGDITMNKKLNINNPADKFINTDKKQGTDNTGNTPNTVDADETKSKRLNLLVKPSVLDQFKKIATMEQTSTNDLINQVMENYVSDNKEKIELYDKVFKGNAPKQQ